MKPMPRVPAKTEVVMVKGYRGAGGVVSYPTDSRFDLYVITLNNGMKIVAGPSAFQLARERGTGAN